MGGSAWGCGGSASSTCAGGQQPIFNEDRTMGIVFNGEIYNYRELRDDLRARAPLLDGV